MGQSCELWVTGTVASLLSWYVSPTSPVTCHSAIIFHCPTCLASAVCSDPILKTFFIEGVIPGRNMFLSTVRFWTQWFKWKRPQSVEINWQCVTKSTGAYNRVLAEKKTNPAGLQLRTWSEGEEKQGERLFLCATAMWALCDFAPQH